MRPLQPRPQPPEAVQGVVSKGRGDEQAVPWLLVLGRGRCFRGAAGRRRITGRSAPVERDMAILEVRGLLFTARRSVGKRARAEELGKSHQGARRVVVGAGGDWNMRVARGVPRSQHACEHSRVRLIGLGHTAPPRRPAAAHHDGDWVAPADALAIHQVRGRRFRAALGHPAVSQGQKRRFALPIAHRQPGASQPQAPGLDEGAVRGGGSRRQRRAHGLPLLCSGLASKLTLAAQPHPRPTRAPFCFAGRGPA